MNALTGIVCIRNGEELDYCWKESIKSLLPVCDSVTVCDGESTDGTQEIIRDWMTREPRIVLCVYPWPNPVGDSDFWVKWLQYARQHCPPGRIIQLDADEILHEKSYNAVSELSAREGVFTVKMRRWNFWRDARHLVPEGVCLAHLVNRMGPQNVFLPSDGPHPEGAAWSNMAINEPRIEVFHYGFLRKRDAWFKKANALQKMFFNSYDERLITAEKFEGNWMEYPGVSGWEDKLTDFNGTHPEVILQWLKERGYAP